MLLQSRLDSFNFYLQVCWGRSDEQSDRSTSTLTFGFENNIRGCRVGPWSWYEIEDRGSWRGYKAADVLNSSLFDQLWSFVFTPLISISAWSEWSRSCRKQLKLGHVNYLHCGLVLWRCATTVGKVVSRVRYKDVKERKTLDLNKRLSLFIVALFAILTFVIALLAVVAKELSNLLMSLFVLILHVNNNDLLHVLVARKRCFELIPLPKRFRDNIQRVIFGVLNCSFVLSRSVYKVLFKTVFDFL